MEHLKYLLHSATLEGFINTVVGDNLRDNTLGGELRFGVEHWEALITRVTILLKDSITILGPLMNKAPARLADSSCFLSQLCSFSRGMLGFQ